MRRCISCTKPTEAFYCSRRCELDQQRKIFQGYTIRELALDKDHHINIHKRTVDQSRLYIMTHRYRQLFGDRENG